MQLIFTSISIFLAMIPKVLNIGFAQAEPIEFGHTLQPLNRPIDIVPCDQPLGTLLNKEVEESDQEQRK